MPARVGAMMQGSIAKTVVLAMTRFWRAAPSRGRRPAIRRRPTSATDDEQRNIFTLQIENDVFNRFSPIRPRLYQRRAHRLAVAGACTDLPAGLVALTTMPTFFGERAVGLGDPPRRHVDRPEHLHAAGHASTSQPIYNDRPYAGWLYASFALQYDLQARRSEDRHGRAGAARHPAGRSRPDRPGGGRRVRAEQLPSA